jgi:hypothetical protein
MIHLCLFLLIVAAGFFDAIGDSLKDIKTHFGDAGDALGRKGHPYKDFFHLVKYGERACLIGIGLVYPMAHYDDRWAALIALASGLIVGRAVWDATYKQSEFWLRLDEQIKISTGIKWLDKWLGLHW